MAVSSEIRGRRCHRLALPGFASGPAPQRTGSPETGTHRFTATAAAVTRAPAHVGVVLRRAAAGQLRYHSRLPAGPQPLLIVVAPLAALLALPWNSA